MIISEKQLMQLIALFTAAIEYNLTPTGMEEANQLLADIEAQQSEELKEIK
jgi:hypothetical protein